ncbi:MAG: class I SAM-dependent methyltransferase [Simkaniaceae bacterium]|nr:class I SAM-dependent methyltransferase [Simkaniaceae bacterium]
MKKLATTLFSVLIFSALAAGNVHQEKLYRIYEQHYKTPSDIHQHLPAMRELAKECSSVAEFGVRGMVSTWGFLQGMSENQNQQKSYIAVDLDAPPLNKLRQAKDLATALKIKFRFIRGNDLHINIPRVDLIFIDTLHTYKHLSFELEKFCHQAKKYICLHDTSPPWGHQDEPAYYQVDPYPAWIDRNKRGLWPAVVDFLARHPEWKLKKRYTNCHGFTILQRQ